MLRVTINRIGNESEARVEVQGRLAGPDVVALHDAIAEHRAAFPDDRLAVDLRAVTYADSMGIETIRSLVNDDFDRVACSAFIRQLIKGDKA